LAAAFAETFPSRTAAPELRHTLHQLHGRHRAWLASMLWQPSLIYQWNFQKKLVFFEIFIFWPNPRLLVEVRL
jgi:hypothetical protein